jgi:hypothetical protein
LHRTPEHAQNPSGFLLLLRRQPFSSAIIDATIGAEHDVPSTCAHVVK